MTPHPATAETVSTLYDFDSFVGTSPIMQRLYAMLERAGPSDAPVLLTGPTGSGKELAALSLHRRSRRAAAPLLTLNCAALPHDMIESELFGYRRGAFTGAVSDHPGLLGRVAGGTLFLDEISEMPVVLQAKLLRALENGTYTPLGDTRERQADMRIIAASNREPTHAMHDGHLRPDLYYRLAGLHIALPSLKARGRGDIQRLAQFLLGKICRAHNKDTFPTLTPAALDWLSQQSLPGNIRELENMLRHAVILQEADRIEVHHLSTFSAALADLTAPLTLAAAERQHIENAIQICDGNLTAAARRLDIDVSTLHRKRKSWDSDSSGVPGL